MSESRPHGKSIATKDIFNACTVDQDGSLAPHTEMDGYKKVLEEWFGEKTAKSCIERGFNQSSMRRILSWVKVDSDGSINTSGFDASAPGLAKEFPYLSSQEFEQMRTAIARLKSKGTYHTYISNEYGMNLDARNLDAVAKRTSANSVVKEVFGDALEDTLKHSVTIRKGMLTFITSLDNTKLSFASPNFLYDLYQLLREFKSSHPDVSVSQMGVLMKKVDLESIKRQVESQMGQTSPDNMAAKLETMFISSNITAFRYITHGMVHLNDLGKSAEYANGELDRLQNSR